MCEKTFKTFSHFEVYMWVIIVYESIAEFTAKKLGSLFNNITNRLKLFSQTGNIGIEMALETV